MNEESTRELPDNTRPFEARVFARFDAIDARFHSIDARFDSMDARFDSMEVRLERLESRSYDTKPIWEQALAAIAETQQEVGEIKSKVEIIEGKVQKIEDDVSTIKTEQRTMREEFVAAHRDLTYHYEKSTDALMRLVVDQRESVRDTQSRVRELETKLA